MLRMVSKKEKESIILMNVITENEDIISQR